MQLNRSCSIRTTQFSLAHTSSPYDQAVAGLPRLFVGQIPIDKDEHDLMPLFSTYGNVEKIKVVRALDGKSKGCAMVQFLRWTEAEAALEAINGTSPFDDAVHRPLLVRFANPRRNGALTLGSNESAIAPRKLFVGQVSVHSLSVVSLSFFLSSSSCCCITPSTHSHPIVFHSDFQRYISEAIS